MRIISATILLACSLSLGATKITFDANRVMEVDGKKTFVVSFSLPPPADGKTPDGKDAFAELKDAGANYMRIGIGEKGAWNDQTIREVDAKLDVAAKNGMLCWITLRELTHADLLKKPEKEEMLRKVIAHYKD